MTKNVGILIFNNAEVLDFAGPFEVFSVTAELNNYEPFKVFTLGLHAEPISAVNGLKVVPDFTIHDHPPIDILIIPGGSGSRNLIKHEAVLKWIEKIHRTTEITMSICSGSRLLGKLGLLDHKPFCTHHQVYEHMKEIAPLAVPQNELRFVQSDARIFTSGGISAGIDLSFYIVTRLLGNDVARRTAEYMEYNYEPQSTEHYDRVVR